MCLFCQIAKKEIAAKILFEDDDLVAFSDIHPVAPTHALVIPRRHLVSLNEAAPADAELLGKLILAAQRVAREAKISDAGWRVVVNTGAHAGQSVFHVHVHVLGGRPMAWPPG
ncbi:MAG TPA: histidine triad nucleotide-binding protein [Polyangiaceae bacterium]|jgi:histidine triad (HIT) family protein|nr:histidine triad nucleotide-binding protein [Polyangiaceae bacterium]